MAITDATEFSTFDDDGDTNGSGVITADTFNEWRKKVNGIINKLVEVSNNGNEYPRKVIVTNYLDHHPGINDSEMDGANGTGMDNDVNLRTSWVSPYTGTAKITCIGAGGGGGGGGTDAQGGGGGEVAISFIPLVSGTTYTISIGTAGDGGGATGSLDASDGGATSWNSGQILANGGHGGGGQGNAYDGAGGTGGTGTYLIAGGTGGGVSGDLNSAKHGGDSYYPGAAGFPGASSAEEHLLINSAAPWQYGAGGGGSTDGGRGGPGAIIIEF